MAKKKFERSCSICSTKYQFCPNCSDFDKLPRWMDAYCSERCKEIYNITAGFLNHWLEPEIEAARLSELTLDKEYIEKLPDWMKDAINQLQQVDTTNAKAIMSALKDESSEVKPAAEEVKNEEPEKATEDNTIVNEDRPLNDNRNKSYQNKKIKPKFAAK